MNSENDFRQDGRNVLLTGGSSGIGYELRKLFAGDGFDLILVAQNEKSLSDRKEEFKKSYAVMVKTIAMDLSDPG